MKRTLFRSLPHLTRYCSSLGVVAALATGSLSLCDGQANVIRPGEKWLDDRGQIIEAHGGAVVRFGGIFYWFGENHDSGHDRDKRFVNCYSSTDLVHWKFRNEVVSLSDPEHLGPGWILERPRVFYNAHAKKYVMYVHLDDHPYKLARVAVLTSDTVDGSYRYIRSFRPLGQESRDIGEFIDDDGTPYLLFESRPTKGLFIAALSDDYLDVVKQTAFIKEPLEGDSLVHYQDHYFFVGSHLTGYNSNPDVYAFAPSVAGPWSAMKDIAPPETKTYDSQSTMLLKVTGSKSTSVIYIGDRWNAGDLPDSRYIWMPLTIRGTDLSLPRPQNWTIDVHTGVTRLVP